MSSESKVTAAHLQRDAWLYVRQSTMRQVVENSESTARQYALRDRAVALGWPIEHIHTIDDDLGESGASQGRTGFRKLIAEIATGRAGLVLSLEVSRLARRSSDWHRLLEICAITDTLILDEDGIYNPTDFNDRILLGLKGTVSEAELHFLNARMRGGLLNKARRGELKMPLPIGLVYDPLDRVVLDPDAQIQETINHLFESFARIGSACATVRHFRKENILFPARGRGAPQNGEIFWQDLTHSRMLKVLHNPRYAGAFAYGRSTSRVGPEGRRIHTKVPQDEWQVLIRDAHPGYISWERFEANRAQLRANGQARGLERRSAPREGPALLQGIVLCGHCGRNMTIRYHQRAQRTVPTYICQTDGIENATKVCQSIPGDGIDRNIGELLIELMTPASMEMTLKVQDELTRRAAQADALRARKVQRAAQAAELARQRFMAVHPDNRLVADTLEAQWNQALRTHYAEQQEYDKQSALDGTELSDAQRKRILELAGDFARLWQDPQTADRERKRMVRVLIEDVTLSSHDDDGIVTLGVRLPGGANRTLRVARDLRPYEKYRTKTAVIEQIDALIDHHTDGEIAEILNQRGYRTGYGLSFDVNRVFGIRSRYRLKTRYQRLREQNLLTLSEIAQVLGISTWAVKRRRQTGIIRGYRYNERNECLYELPATADEPDSHLQAEDSMQ